MTKLTSNNALNVTSLYLKQSWNPPNFNPVHVGYLNNYVKYFAVLYHKLNLAFRNILKAAKNFSF